MTLHVRLLRGIMTGILSASLSYIAISFFRFPRDLQAPSTLIFASGQRVPGAISAAQVEKFLGDGK